MESCPWNLFQKTVDASGNEKLLLETERSQLLARREKEIVGIERELLTRYDRVALKHKPAVVVTPGKACPLCHMAVPAQRASEMKREGAVYTCGGCQRLLVSPKALRE